MSLVPAGQLNPLWAAPGKIIAARRDMLVLQIFDLVTQQWSDVTKPEDGPVINWAHSPDFSYFYYTTSGQNARLVRVRGADLQSEVVASRKDIHLPVGSGTTAQMSVAPDGSLIFLRSARASMLKKVLDTAGIAREACLHQQGITPGLRVNRQKSLTLDVSAIVCFEQLTETDAVIG